MKYLTILLLTAFTLMAGELDFEDIETTVLMKKDRAPVNVHISLALQGRDVSQASRYQLMDVIQTVVGGLWAESLVTSQGKTELKKRIVSLAVRQYGLEVDFVYILNIRLEVDTLQKCLELIKAKP